MEQGLNLQLVVLKLLNDLVWWILWQKNTLDHILSRYNDNKDLKVMSIKLIHGYFQIDIMLVDWMAHEARQMRGI